MKNRAVLKFFLIYFGFTITSNFVHPITPAFLQMIEAPSYIQGVAFSVMSFFTFLTAPFWGKMGDRKPYPKMIAFGYFGYALGQTVFAAARSVPMLLAARTISGLLNGALQVNALAYLISVSDSESRGKYMAYYAMLQSVGTCIGYFVGGSIGDYSLMLVFYIQIASVLFLGVISPIVLRDAPGRQLETGRINYQEINPVASMFTSMKKVDAAMGVYLATVFCFGFAMMAYDNYFSYFLRDQLGFPTSVNGYFKALIGVIAIIANSTINMWINKHTDVRKSITVILAMSSVSVAMMVSFKSVLPFMASALVYYTFNAITVPVLQVMMMKDEDKNQAGTISGLYNAFWALGRTVGPLIAAFVYGINPLYPFMLAAAVYMLAAVLSVWNRFQYKNRKPRLVTE